MNEKFTMVYSFYTNAFIKSNFDKLKSIMEVFPDSLLISDGTVIKYVIGGKNQNTKDKSLNNSNSSYDNLIILEFKKDNIRAMFYSNKNYIEKRAVCLLKFLSILEYVKDVYDIILDGLYQEIISALTPFVLFQNYNYYNQSNQSKYYINDKRIAELSASNYALSKEILRLSKINQSQKHTIEIFENFYKQIISKLSNSIGEDSTKTLIQLGINKEILNELSKIDK